MVSTNSEYLPAFKDWLLRNGWTLNSAPISPAQEVRQRMMQGRQLEFEAKHPEGVWLAVFVSGSGMSIIPDPLATEVFLTFSDDMGD